MTSTYPDWPSTPAEKLIDAIFGPPQFPSFEEWKALHPEGVEISLEKTLEKYGWVEREPVASNPETHRRFERGEQFIEAYVPNNTEQDIARWIERNSREKVSA